MQRVVGRKAGRHVSTILSGLVVLALLGAPWGALAAEGGTPPVVDAQGFEQRVREGAGLDTPRFVPNTGQWHEAVRYTADTTDGLAFVMDDGIALQAVVSAPVPQEPTVEEDERPEPPVLEAPEVAFLRIGWGQDRAIEPLGATGVRHHTYIGDDATTWTNGVESHERLLVRDVAEGIDLVVYGTPEGRLEIDHRVAAGADPARAFLDLPGATDLRLDGGDLVAVSDGHEFVLEAPIATQDGRDVPVSFRIADERVRYHIGAYDPSRPLVIDPIVRTASLLGSSNTDYGMSIAVADANTTGHVSVYMAGYKYGAAVPAIYSSGITYGSGSYDAFVAKLDYDPSLDLLTPEWFAQFGGRSYDVLYDLDATSAEVAFSGYTYSYDLPTRASILEGGYSGARRAGSYDAFAATLDKDGLLTFATYLGGTGSDFGYSIVHAPGGDLVVSGYTDVRWGSGFPLKDQVMGPQGFYDTFVTRIDRGAPRASLDFSTVLGGGYYDFGNDVAVDAHGIYVTGYTYTSSWYPPMYPTTPGAFMTSPVSTWFGVSAFATRLGHDGSMAWSTLLDRASSDYAYGIAGDGTGGAWITGSTYSWDWWSCPVDCPVGAQLPLEAASSGSREGFVVHLDNAGSDLLWSTVFGSSGYDYPRDITVAPNGNVGVAGYTSSAAGFPLVNDLTGSGFGGYDGFVMYFDPAAPTSAPGDQIEVSALVGSTGYDQFYKVDADAHGGIYAGGRASGDSAFPFTNAVQTSSAGSYDAMLAILGKAPPNVIVTGRGGGLLHDTTMDGALEVLTFTDVNVDAWASLDGDLPIDWSAGTYWELKNETGAVLASDMGSPGGPAFAPINMPDDVIVYACATLYDISPPGTVARAGTACLEIEFLNRAPKADFTFDPVKVAMDRPLPVVDLSTDRDGTVVGHKWKFHDGTVNTGLQPTYEYPYTGTFPLELTVTDDDGATDTITKDVIVEKGPTAKWLHDGDPVVAGDPIGFTDDSTAGWREIESWSWDFGDGATKDDIPWPAPVGHRWQHPGTFPVTLTVFDGYFHDSYTADVQITPTRLTPFDDAYEVIQDNPLTVLGNAYLGILANDFHPLGQDLDVDRHTAPGAGDLTVDHATGAFTYTPPAGFIGTTSFEYWVTDGHSVHGPATVVLDVIPYPPPVAEFEPKVIGRDVVLEDRSRPGFPDHPITSWSWRFGDGASDELPGPVHRYAGPGTYTVVLTVTDSIGQSSTTAKTVRIAEARPAPLLGVDPPVADAGADRAARPGDNVLLDGSGSTPADLHHEWVQVAGPRVALHGAHTALAHFLAPDVPKDTVQELRFALRVYDGKSWSTDDEVVVEVGQVNRAPALDVQATRTTVRPGEHVHVPVSASDPDGDDVELRWEQVDGLSVQRDDAEGLSFQAPMQPGRLTWSAVATDGQAETTAEVTIDVRADGPARPDFTATGVSTGRVLLKADAPEDVSVRWDFGDKSSPSNARQVEHAFPGAGPYLVTLVVTDAEGRSAVLAREVTPPGPVLRSGAQVDVLDAAPAPAPAPEADVEEAAPGVAVVVLLGLLGLLARRRR